MLGIRLRTVLATTLTVLPAISNAFWRLPCRGRTGVARLDPIIDPGHVSGHAHTIHGGGNFGVSTDMHTLRESSCTSCGVEQDLSAYWTPALYFMHANGSAEIVEEVGGMLAYYLLYGDNVTAFPDDFRMVAGDPFQRNFTWPIPDPPKSSWSGAQSSQAALRQKALGFNCLNYNEDPEPTLYRHFLPNKAYLDEHCTDGLRLELMFPSCWNGKDVDSTDHNTHVVYPSLVIDGTCPEGYETRLVSLFYETIWNTYAFKDQDGFFALANGDPTGFGYHGDFMFGWQEGVLQEAVKTCTNQTGEVSDCEVFSLQTEDKQRQCSFEMPEEYSHDPVLRVEQGLPGGVPIQWGPGYAKSPSSSISSQLVPSISIAVPTLSLGLDLDTGNFFGNANVTRKTGTGSAATTTTSSSTSELSSDTSTPTPAPTVHSADQLFIEEVVYLEQDVTVYINDKGAPYVTRTGTARTISSTTTTITEAPTMTSLAEKREDVSPNSEERPQQTEHARKHAHRHGNLHKRVT